MARIDMSEKTLTVRQIASLLGVEVIGSDQGLISSMASPDQAGPDDVTYAVDKRFESQLNETRAGCAIVSRHVSEASVPQLVVENVKLAVSDVLDALAPEISGPRVGVDPSAGVCPDAEISGDAAVGPCVTIGPGSKVGSGSVLHAGVTIAANVVIGSGCVLMPGVVVLDRCVLGDRVLLGPNTVIGADGFGYETVGGVHRRIPHIGNAVIEDDVEIGACSCVDRAKFGSTIVGAGSKIDNLVQIAHNVRTGKGCILCAQVGVAGSVKLGDYVVAGGHAGFRDNITVGSQVQCSAFAAVAGDVPEGKAVAGIPAHDARHTYRELRALERLPELLKQVRAIEARLESLVQTEDN